MYGPAIKVDFTFKQLESERVVDFPEGNWLNLNTFE